MPSQGMPGATAGGYAVLSTRMRQHDGAGGRLEQRLFFQGEMAECTRGGEIADHHGKRLAIAVLALAETHDGVFAGRIHAEVETADALDGHDFAGEKPLDGFGDGVGLSTATIWRSPIDEDPSIGGPWVPSQTCGPQREQALGCA